MCLICYNLTRLSKSLSVEWYCGVAFPKWIGDPSFICLASLKLKCCARCTSLPALGKLQAVKDLHIIGMKELYCIDGEFYGQNCLRPFPSLERLHFTRMEKWIDWLPSLIKKQLNAFPCLQELSIV